jgi:hypothetical protein
MNGVLEGMVAIVLQNHYDSYPLGNFPEYVRRYSLASKERIEGES